MKILKGDTVHFSAAELAKKTARQIQYARAKDLKVVVSNLMLEGNEYAEKSSESKYVEMSGSFVTQKGYPIVIHFAIDEVQLFGNSAILIEHKMVKFEPEDWYIQGALIQTALYKALVKYSNGILTTAEYQKGMKYTINVSEKSLFSKLNFGGNWYGVDCEPKGILQYFVKKARSTIEYKTAAEFDSKFKGKEWMVLDKYIRKHRI